MRVAHGISAVSIIEGKAMKTRTIKSLLFGVLAVGTLAASAAQAAAVAIVGETSRWTQVVPLFEGLGDTVTLHSSYSAIPNLQAYDIIWDADFFADAGATQAQRVIDFVNSGRGFYGQVERPCCESHNAWLQGIFRTLTGDLDIVFGGAGDSPIAGPSQFLFPDLSILLEPNDIRGTTFDTSAPGQLAGIDPARIFATIQAAGGFNVGAAWATDDLVNDAGRLVVVSDVDWLNSISADEADALENFRLFLLAGEPLPPGCGEDPSQPGCDGNGGPVGVPEPGTLGLLGLAVVALRLSRRNRRSA